MITTSRALELETLIGLIPPPPVAAPANHVLSKHAKEVRGHIVSNICISSVRHAAPDINGLTLRGSLHARGAEAEATTTTTTTPAAAAVVVAIASVCGPGHRPHAFDALYCTLTHATHQASLPQ